jgi:hypothetical protein
METRSSPAARFSGKGALVVDGGKLLVVSGKKESMDDVQKNTGSSKVQLASSIASCQGAKERLEAVRGVGDVGR